MDLINYVLAKKYTNSALGNTVKSVNGEIPDSNGNVTLAEIDNAIVTQTTGNGTALVMSQNAVTEALDVIRSNIVGCVPYDFSRSFYERNGFLYANGTFDPSNTFHCKNTPKISCLPGDEFLYKGVGNYSTVSAVFYNNTEVVDSLQINSPDDYTSVIIPNNVNGVVFSSYAAIDTEISFDVKMKTSLNTSISEINDKVLAIDSLCSDALIKKCGKNLYSGINDEIGYIADNTGVITYDETWFTTDFIEINHEKQYVVSVLDSDNSQITVAPYFIVEYDSNKQVLSHTSIPTTPYTPSQNTKYIRFSEHSEFIGKVQIEEGAVVTPYEPFKTVYELNGYTNSDTLNKWKGKKWCCIGDSLTESNDKTTMNYHDYISKKTGIAVTNMGLSGSGYKRREDTNNAFYQRVNSISTDYDVITIFGSGNDIVGTYYTLGEVTDTSLDTLCGCINRTIDVIYEKYLAASKIPIIGIVTPTPWIGSNFDDYSNAIIQICKNRSIPCLDLYRCSGLNPNNEDFRQLAFSKDNGSGVHPDETGHKIIAPRFESFLDSLIWD